MRFHYNTERVRERGTGQPLVGKAVWILPPRQEEALADFLRSGKSLQGLDIWRGV